MIGIDEAGRGPVLGPMVYGAAFCSLATGKVLGKRSFADSKALKEDTREVLFKDIIAATDLGFVFDSLSAAVISQQMLAREKISLNKVANDSTYGLIQKILDAGANVTEVYVDTVGSASVYQAKLSERFPGIKFVVESKADATYPIVSAASIVAKVTRDHEIRDFVFLERGAAFTREFGSGYPSDPKTKAWLPENMHPLFGFPSLVRFSWQTCKDILGNKGIDVKFDCDEDEDEPKGQTKLTFGAAAAAAAGGPKGKTLSKRCGYFRTRSMALVTTPLVGRAGAGTLRRGTKRAPEDSGAAEEDRDNYYDQENDFLI